MKGANLIKIMNNGKIYDFLKNNWHYILFGVALFAGVVCGIRACSKSVAVDVNARRNVITISKTK